MSDFDTDALGNKLRELSDLATKTGARYANNRTESPDFLVSNIVLPGLVELSAKVNDMIRELSPESAIRTHVESLGVAATEVLDTASHTLASAAGSLSDTLANLRDKISGGKK
jgi:hypothetical protein